MLYLKIFFQGSASCHYFHRKFSSHVFHKFEVKICGFQSVSYICWTLKFLPISVVSMLLFTLFFSVGLAPIPIVIAAEIFPYHLRDLFTSVSTSAFYTVTASVTLAFGSLYPIIGVRWAIGNKSIIHNHDSIILVHVIAWG